MQLFSYLPSYPHPKVSVLSHGAIYLRTYPQPEISVLRHGAIYLPAYLPLA